MRRVICKIRVIFGVWFERQKVDKKKQTYTKTETCRLYSRVFWIFLPNVIKIDQCNFELYRFKVGAFFWDTVYNSCHLVYLPLELLVGHIERWLVWVTAVCLGFVEVNFRELPVDADKHRLDPIWSHSRKIGHFNKSRKYYSSSRGSGNGSGSDSSSSCSGRHYIITRLYFATRRYFVFIYLKKMKYLDILYILYYIIHIILMF